MNQFGFERSLSWRFPDFVQLLVPLFVIREGVFQVSGIPGLGINRYPVWGIHRFQSGKVWPDDAVHLKVGSRIEAQQSVKNMLGVMVSLEINFGILPPGKLVSL